MYFIVPAIFAALNVLLIGVCFYLKNITSKKLNRDINQVDCDIMSEHIQLAKAKTQYEESLKN